MINKLIKNRVGFIGLGNMGLPMASNLVKNGFQVKAFDLSQSTLDKCSQYGIVQSNKISEVSKGVDFIITSLPKTNDVAQVLCEKNGVFDNADKGTVICDTSTISPIASKEFSDLAKDQNLVFCDTPMSGGIMGAQNGTLTFMVGANSKEDYELASIVLEGMGKKIFHCGGPGTGEIAKICNNMILGIQMVACSEGMVLGEKLGIDPKVLHQILSVSTSNCWCINSANPRPGNIETAPSSRNYEGGFQVGLIRKDMSLALELAEKVHSNVHFAEESMKYYLELEKEGHGRKDFGYVFQYINKKKSD